MKLNFSRCLNITLAHEGGWSDRITDPGGATMKGVTLRTYSDYLKRAATKQELMDISEDEIKDIYYNGYWMPVGGNVLSPGLDLVMFDFAVHSGPGRAISHLQSIAGTRMDGKMGPITLAGVGAFESKWGTKELIIRLMASRSKFLRSTNLWKEYGRGFAKRLYSVEQEALKLEAEG